MTNVFWMEQRSRDVPAGNDWLAPGELARLANLRFDKRRAEWRLGRWTAKRALSAYAGGLSEMAGIEIRASTGGVPIAFFAGRRASVSISLSHRAGIGLCAIAPIRTRLGCDVELIEPRPAAFAEHYFTGEEQQRIHSATGTDRDRLITLCWSAKESVLKALGVGLRRSTNDVCVHPAGQPAGGKWKALCAHSSEGEAFHGWWREDATLLRTIVVAMPGGRCLLQA